MNGWGRNGMRTEWNIPIHEKEWNNAICRTWMHLEVILLSEVSQKETNITWYHLYKDFPVAQTVKNLLAVQETRVWSLGQEDPLEKGMAIQCSILAWRIPWTEEPGRLQSMGSQRVGHDWSDFSTQAHAGSSCPWYIVICLWRMPWCWWLKNTGDFPLYGSSRNTLAFLWGLEIW